MNSEHIKPGEGAKIEKTNLAETRNELKNGTFIIDQPSQQMVISALTNPNTPQECIKAILYRPQNKIFRNAYASLIIENAWNYGINQLLDTNELYILKLNQDLSTSLSIIPEDRVNNMPYQHIAKTIGKSVQGVLSHYICEQSRNGKIPEISNNNAKNLYYFEAFKEQTDLDLRAGSSVRTLPDDAPSQNIFTTSGTLVVRTHIFGLPNLIDTVSQRDGIFLNPDEHRNAFLETMKKTIPPYYLPPTVLTNTINRQLINLETYELNPDSWTHNNARKNLLVYPRQEIVKATNLAFAEGDLPIQTACPAFSSRVSDEASTTNDNSKPIPFAKALNTLAINLLDKYYYPKRLAAFNNK